MPENKHAFVRFTEKQDDGSYLTSVLLASGEAAEDPDEFISWHLGGRDGEVIDWFQVPDEWPNAVASGDIKEAFEAILNLDALAEVPKVSDMLATIFEAGYQLAMKKMAAASRCRPTT